MIQPCDNSGQNQPSSGLNDPLADPHSTPCQPDSVWLDLCTGNLPEDQASSYLRHAAECPTCGPIFREAVHVFTEQATPEEEALLARMATSQPANQRALAYRLTTLGTPPSSAPSIRVGFAPQKPTWRHRLLTWPSLTLAATACALVVTAFYLHSRPSGDDALLANAYDRHRVSELRIPGEKAGPLYSPTRGTGAGDLSSHDLLELKLRTQEAFERAPNNAQVRQMQGRIALVDHDGEAARRQFEMAEALDPTLPRLKFDLASADFELAETTGQGIDYARAIDLYSQYLHSVNGQDATALFDRGLCWERSAVTFEAIKDFQAALALEKDSAWRKLIEQHLTHLKSTDLPPGNAPLTPQSFLAVPPTSPQFDAPGRYEQYLDVASREWLPNRQTPQTAQALTTLATLGELHKDFWLTDFLAAPPAPEADAPLSSALQSSLEGHYGDSLALSAKADDLYKAAGNQPGYVRASAEHLFALHRLGRAPDSITEADLLQAGPEIHRFRWISLFVALEQDGDHAMLGHLSDPGANEEIRLAADQSHLPLIKLRALTFDASSNTLRKRYDQAWTETMAAMQLMQASVPNPVRKFQLIYGAREIAQSLELNGTAAGLTEAAAMAARTSVNQQAAAFALEQLAMSEFSLDEPDLATSNFRLAQEMLARLGDPEIAETYRALWASDLAKLRATTGSIALGLADFAAAAPRIASLRSVEERINFFTQYSLLLRRAGNLPEAIKTLWIALQDVESTKAVDRRNSNNPATRLDAELSYQLLTLELAEAGHPELALRCWEWHRSAPDRKPTLLAGTGTFKDLEETFPGIPQRAPSHATLVIARTVDRILLWNLPPAGEGEVTMQILPEDADLLLRESRSYTRMAGDPQSSTTDLALLGKILAHALLQPTQARAMGTPLLRLDLDTSLAELPFAALPVDGKPLIMSRQLVTLMPDWTLHDPATQPPFPPATSVVVLRQFQSTGNGMSLPDEHDESSQISRYFPSTRIERAALGRTARSLALSGSPGLTGALREAAIVHYAGHGLEELSSIQSAAPVLSLPRCRLAVLAACRSLNEREESSQDVPSFAHIVLAAGARQVLATQWDVDSEMTRRLMLSFYDQLSKGSSSPAALAYAQQALLADPATQHPYYWSAFQIVTR